MLILLLVLFICFSVTTKILYRQRSFLLIIILGWWFFWLSISTFSLTGNFTPNNNTYYHFILFISSIFLGYLLNCFIFIDKVIITPAPSTFAFIKKEKKLNNLLLILSLFIIYFFIKTLYLYNTGTMTSAQFRVAALGFEDGKSLVFGNMKFLFLYKSIIIPLVYAIFFTSIGLWLSNNRVKPLLFSSALLFMISITDFGRFPIYIVIFIITTFSIIKYRSMFKLFSGKRLFFSLFSLGLIIYISFIRLSGESWKEVLLVFFVDYHTLSFSMYDILLNDPTSILNSINSYGRYSLGVVDIYFSLLFKYLGFDVFSQTSTLGGEFDNFIVVGENINGNPKTANAFYSIVTNLYIDFGYIGISLGGIILGFMVSYHLNVFYSTLRSYNLAIASFITYLIIFGIFMPILAGNYLIILFFIFILNKRFVLHLKN